MNDQRDLRLADFDARARFDPEGLFEDASVGSYIAVHPMADEEEVLKRLGVTRDTCTSVDCYWKYDDDVYFLQVDSSTSNPRETGLWARTSEREPHHVNLVAVVEEHDVTRETVHRVMHLFKPVLARKLTLGESLVRV